MEENNGIKVAHIINLPTLNIKSQLNINIDNNTYVKQVLNVEASLIESSIEPMFNKAVVKGSIGVKVVYLDLDNMYNTLAEVVNFSETINSENITADCQINICNSQFIADFTSDDKLLKINLEGNIDCFCNLNSVLTTFNPNSDNLITKKSVLKAYSCVQQVNKTTTFDDDFKLDYPINKMLCCDSKIIIEDASCYDGYILISGQIFNTLLCEVANNEVKITTNSTNFKCEVEANSCDSDCIADLYASINLNNTQISTDIGDTDTKLSFEYCIMVNGYIYKVVNMDVIEDLYSLTNDVESIVNPYRIYNKTPYFKSNENVDAEITLADEINIDQILGVINTGASTTQTQVKDGLISIEGVISGNLLYLDENGQINHLPTQLPYSINIKQEISEEVSALRLNIIPTACRCKIKRGNTLIIEYEVCVIGNIYTYNSIELIDNVKFGKAISYGDIAFQIYVAHKDETCWDLCKRLHITEDKLIQYNKENPATYSGGEKIIVYR